MHSYRPLIPQLLMVLFLLVICRGTVQAAEQRVSFSIPALGVVDQGGKLVGATHYLVVQIDRLPDLSGPQVQFNEGSRAFGNLKGAALSPDWERRCADGGRRGCARNRRGSPALAHHRQERQNCVYHPRTQRQ